MSSTKTLTEVLKGHQPSSSLPLPELLESACEGSILVDRHCRVIWISEKYRPLLGISEEVEILGREIEQVIPNSLMRQVVESGHPQLLDLMRFDSRWFVVTRLPLKDSDGNILGAIGFVFFDQLDYLRPLVDKFTRLQARHSVTAPQHRNTRYTFEDLIGSSAVMLRLRQQALRASRLDTTLLLLGETGTGKELLAQAVHNASGRAAGPFVGVNTAALPETLVEAELFGADPGAYTGADRRGRKGKFEQAAGGTLFLDEIGEMPTPVQAKLLRVLQERQIEPLGGNRVIPVDVRIIAATSRDLEQLVADGLFRADLYYRLNVVQLNLPPLRERLEDLPQLCSRINGVISEELGTPRVTADQQLLERLAGWHWPGNVRELRNVLERIYLFADQPEVSADALDTLTPVRGHPQPVAAPVENRSLAEVVAEAEQQAIEAALQACADNRSRAAKKLGISRATLYEKMARFR